MAKKLNIAAITSELSEGSVFFPSYKKQDSPTETQQREHVVEPAQTKTPVPPARVVRDVPPVPQKKRVMKQRHPFDIWQDQYESLVEISLAERKLGGMGSQSAMAREGLDWIIAKKKKELNLE